MFTLQWPETLKECTQFLEDWPIFWPVSFLSNLLVGLCVGWRHKFYGAFGLFLAYLSKHFTTRMSCPSLFFILLPLWLLFFSPFFALTWSLSFPESCLCSLGVFVRSSLSYLALSGSGQETRSWPPVRARPTPKQQLAVKGEAGECVRPPLCPLAFDLFVCLPAWGLTHPICGNLSTLGGFLIKKTEDSIFVETKYILQSVRVYPNKYKCDGRGSI